MALCVFLIPSYVSATVIIGPGSLPSWDGSAQVKLGWIFSDPTDPSNTDLVTGWQTAIGDIPTWNYDSTREAWDQPAQWYIQVPNVEEQNPVKHFWLAWVYDFNYLDDPRTYTNIDWPDATGFTNLGITDEWFEADGTPTTELNSAIYGRMTIVHDLYPNPDYEDIYLGLKSAGFYVREVYLETQCVPIPGAVWLLGSGIIGIVGIRRKHRR